MILVPPFGATKNKSNPLSTRCPNQSKGPALAEGAGAGTQRRGRVAEGGGVLEHIYIHSYKSCIVHLRFRLSGMSCILCSLGWSHTGTHTGGLWVAKEKTVEQPRAAQRGQSTSPARFSSSLPRFHSRFTHLCRPLRSIVPAAAVQSGAPGLDRCTPLPRKRLQTSLLNLL